HPPAKAFGPSPLVIPETPRSEESISEMLEAIGFGGEWFDAHDVEEYLKTKGIALDGHSSFVEVDPSVPALVHRPSCDGNSSSDTDASDSPVVSPTTHRNSNPSPQIMNMGASPDPFNDPFNGDQLSFPPADDYSSKGPSFDDSANFPPQHFNLSPQSYLT